MDKDQTFLVLFDAILLCLCPVIRRHSESNNQTLSTGKNSTITTKSGELEEEALFLSLWGYNPLAG